MNFLSSALLMSGSNALMQVGNLVLRVLLARLLGPALFGSFSLGLNANTVAVKVMSLGMVPSAQYHAGHHGKRPADVLWSTALLNFVIGLAALGLAYAFLPLIEKSLFASQPDAFAIFRRFLPFLPLIFLGMSLSITLIPYRLVMQYSILQMLSSLLLPAAVALGLLFLAPLDAVVASQQVVWAICLALPVMMLWGRFFAKDIRWDLLGSISRYALLAWPNVLLGIGIARFGILYAGTMLSAAEIGLFTLALNINEGLFGLHGAVGQLLLSRVSEDAEKGPLVTQKLFRLSLLILAALCLLYLLAGRPLLILLFGDKFSNSWLLSLVLLFMSIAHALARILSNYFGGIGRPQLITLALGSELAVMLGLIFAQGRLSGGLTPLGLCWACVIAAGAAMLIALEVARRRMACGYAALLLPRKEDIALLAAQARAVVRRKVAVSTPTAVGSA